MDPTKISLLCTNLLLLVGGVWLVAVGTLLMADTDRILLSRLIPSTLPNPLFYYTSLAIISYGLILSAIAVLGCIAAKYANYCLFAFYLFALVVLLVAECLLVLLAMICPQYLGLSLERDDMVDDWQRNYGVPGKEQYTAAADLIQTKFECCGVINGNDYRTSWWSLRELAAPNLVVPMSCCMQGEPKSFLDPSPINNTLCQNKQIDHFRLARHVEGCMKLLEAWLQEHIVLALSGGLALLLYQLILLLIAILTCVKKSHTSKKG